MQSQKPWSICGKNRKIKHTPRVIPGTWSAPYWGQSRPVPRWRKDRVTRDNASTRWVHCVCVPPHAGCRMLSPECRQVSSQPRGHEHGLFASWLLLRLPGPGPTCTVGSLLQQNACCSQHLWHVAELARLDQAVSTSPMVLK